MRRLAALLLACSLALVPTAVLAQNPHFINASAAGPNADGALSVSFKIAGLGDTVTTTVTATADATASYGCLNNGGQFPNAANKQDVAGPVSASGDFTSGKNGQVTGTLTLGPLGSTLVCPPGQTRVLTAVSYQNVVVSSPDDSEAVPGTFSRVFYTP